MGIAIAMQPLAVLAVGAVGARLPWKAALRLAPLVVLPSALLVLAPLVADPHEVWHALFDQVGYPSATHATPWDSLAVHVAEGGVKAGPIRAVAVLVATVASVLVCRRRAGTEVVLWMIAVAFFIRVAAETVLAPYYIWPVLAVGLLLAGRRGWAGLVAFSIFGFAETWFQQAHWHGVWPWWLLTVGPTLVAVGLVFPGQRRPLLEAEGPVARYPAVAGAD
jgi:hypothetical protein